MKIRELMRPHVVTVRPQDTLGNARQQMLWMQVRHLPVTDEGRLIGMLSERDILRHRADGGTMADPVANAMTTPVQVADPDDSVTEVVDRLAHGRIGCLPIVQAGRLVGIVTRTDLLSAYAREGFEAHAQPRA